jgi:hypothetical protein
MDTYTESKLDPFVLLQTGMQVFHRREDTQTRSYSSVRIIFMRLGIAEVHEEPITKELGDVSLVALDNLSADLLIRPDDLPIVFGVELTGESSIMYPENWTGH